MAVPHNATADGNPATEDIKNPAEASPASVSSPSKHNKSLGVRVAHGRTYDSENGKSCHQVIKKIFANHCRQRTTDFGAPCRQIRRDKPCPIKYGEKAEEVALMEDWSCPKCRGESVAHKRSHGKENYLDEPSVGGDDKKVFMQGKDLKKKLKDDVAKAMLSLKEGSHSDAEQENLVSKIRAETEKAHAEMLEIMEQLPKGVPFD
ncbi:hypothetical protein BHE74_00018205 [Ensete ventricosum]|nr:hypothetical protein BHE74_00018205 [Ensete ventricosum]RZR97235.1 hypothetical protein BHM03_00026374 [Ensete ventricosum]